MIGYGRFRVLLQGLLVCGLLNAAHLQAQTPPAAPPMEMTAPADGNGLMTLHAYSNLIQMPVLVLRPDLSSPPPIKPEQFSLSIDNGPRYRPTHVRAESSDPLSLAVVLDFPGTAFDLMPNLSETIDHAVPLGLTPHDHVSLFVMHCDLTEVMRDVPVTPGLLQSKIRKEVADWKERNKARHPTPCEEKVHLWDTLGIATLQLGELPGRRVIIAVTDGVDRGSRNSAKDLAGAMQHHAVTTFGVRPEQTTDRAILDRVKGGPMISSLTSAGQVLTMDPFERISELSGGIALPASNWNAGKRFAHIVELLRGRYVLEFPRPFNTTAGAHQIDVQVAKGGGHFIRSSGTSVPLPDPKIVADPTTLPNDPSLTPQIGKTKSPLPLE